MVIHEHRVLPHRGSRDRTVDLREHTVVLASEFVRPFTDQELVDVASGFCPKRVYGIPHADRYDVFDVGRVPTTRHVSRPLVKLLHRYRDGVGGAGRHLVLRGLSEVGPHRCAADFAEGVDLLYLFGSFQEEGFDSDGWRGRPYRP